MITQNGFKSILAVKLQAIKLYWQHSMSGMDTDVEAPLLIEKNPLFRFA